MISEVRTGSFRIFIFTTRQFKEKSYLIQDLQSQNLLLVDPGDAYDEISEKITELGGSLFSILLTHGHFDHLFSADQLSKQFSVDCMIHANDMKLARRAELYSIRFSKRLAKAPQNIRTFEAPAFLNWDQRKIKIIPSPGHTPGGVAFLIDDILITGDSLFFERIGPTDYPESDFDALKSSVANLLSDCPNDVLILPGHGPNWSVGAAKTWWRSVRDNPPQYSIMGKINEPG